MADLLRHRDNPAEEGVGFIELFFDLVFVFAVAQLSHLLLHELNPLGAYKTLVLFLAVWWVWICTTWCTNFLSTDRLLVRLMLFAIMLLGLLMSTSIPEAFEHRGWAFGIAVAVIQTGRTIVLALALKGRQEAEYRNFVRVAIWFALAGLLWLWGGFGPPEQRLAIWSAALAVELLPAFFGFRVPGLGRSTTRDWTVSAEHMAERCGLFVIIALGETIMLAGATFAGQSWTTPLALAFVAAVIAAIAMWWIYFNIGAERARERFAHSEDRGRMARGAYTYAHMPLVGGIVLMAVAIELALAHPQGHSEPAMIWAACGAVALFVGGNAIFKRMTYVYWPLSHQAGLFVLAAIALIAPALSPLGLLATVTALLVAIAIWETVSLRGSAGKT